METRNDLLLAALINDGNVDNFEPKTRNETILKACCEGCESDITPKTRDEVLLKQLSHKISGNTQDFSSIREAIIDKGVAVPEETPTSEYATKIEEIQTGVTPTGSIEITANGTYDVTDKASAVVSVPTSGGSLKALLDVTKSCYYWLYRYPATSIEGLIAFSDTSEVTNMNSMFYQSSKLTSMPLFDTSKVTNMGYTFFACNNLTTMPAYNTSNVTNMTYTFADCTALTTIPLLDTSKVTDMSYMFVGCSALKSIPALNVSNVTNFAYMFRSDYRIETIEMYGMKSNLDISFSSQFTREALVVVLNNLANVSYTTKLTMGATNLAKLTDDDKAIATAKGWTLA